MVLSDGGGGIADTGAEHREEDDGEDGSENETPTARDFCDHQATVYNRCEDMLCAGATAAGSRQRHWYREDLFPGAAVVVMAIKEMEVLKSHPETCREVWHVGGGK